MFLAKCSNLNFTLKVRESKWLWRVEWPQPDTNFRGLPMRLDDSVEAQEASKLSPVEQKTRQILASEIGIQANLLESHIEKGPRSHIIGAFRILQKRYENFDDNFNVTVQVFSVLWHKRPKMLNKIIFALLFSTIAV